MHPTIHCTPPSVAQARELQGAIDRHTQLIARIPARLAGVLAPMKQDILATFARGLHALNWLSTNIELYIKDACVKLAKCEVNILIVCLI